ncbi:hypothetical protein MANES_18G113101v8 [Manihot esculenta]|uniref:Uncharacterized protein n=1 Tax=Manihot esculenta TaxID=3983 RepID=A0ACB7G0T9_MANES|nr:hypothetical protein MANES_18G113101v8 [Manihot esculenta]
MDVLLEVPSCYMPKRGVSRDAKRLNLSSLLRLYGQEIFKAHRWPDKHSRHPPP